jgi:hypothetical protein
VCDIFVVPRPGWRNCLSGGGTAPVRADSLTKGHSPAIRVRRSTTRLIAARRIATKSIADWLKEKSNELENSLPPWLSKAKPACTDRILARRALQASRRRQRSSTTPLRAPQTEKGDPKAAPHRRRVVLALTVAPGVDAPHDDAESAKVTALTREVTDGLCQLRQTTGVARQSADASLNRPVMKR